MSPAVCGPATVSYNGSCMALDGRDDGATEILAEVMQKMRPCEPPKGCDAAQDWAASFERYLATVDDQIPRNLVAEGYRISADAGMVR